MTRSPGDRAINHHGIGWVDPAAGGAAPPAPPGKVGIITGSGILTRDGVPILQRGIMWVRAIEDVQKRERATFLPGRGIGGRGDAEFDEKHPDRQRLDAWWMQPLREGQVGKLKVGEPIAAEELED